MKWIYACARYVDVLVNKARIYGYSKLEETTVVMFDSIVGVNLKGVMLGMKDTVQRYEMQHLFLLRSIRD